MLIRRESIPDIKGIRALNDLVFQGPAEGTIVDAIRDSCADALSLVAVEGDQIIGHIFFSPVMMDGMKGTEAMGLGPMAVRPEYQRKGIGKALITQGLNELKASGCAVVVVLGHAEYYPKFGFSPAIRYGLKCQWTGVPEDAFMVMFLKKDAEGVVRGTVRYMSEFNEAL